MAVLARADVTTSTGETTVPQTPKASPGVLATSPLLVKALSETFCKTNAIPSPVLVPPKVSAPPKYIHIDIV